MQSLPIVSPDFDVPANLRQARFVHKAWDDCSQTWVYANLMTGDSFDVPKTLAPLFDRVLAKPSDKTIDENAAAQSVRKTLLNKEFLVDDSTDELRILEERYWRKKKNPLFASFAIVLTHSCNLRCVYCNQEHSGPRLRDDDYQAIKSLVDRTTQEVNQLSITWWGGEPLLKIEDIANLSSYFIDLCRARDVEYSAFISTNGVLLTPENCEILRRGRVTSIQVSVDGPKVSHDLSRPAVGGDGTYDAILRGLYNAVEEYGTDDPFITLRTNVSLSTPHDLPSWEGFLADLRPISSALKLTFVPVIDTFRFSNDKTLANELFLSRYLPIMDEARSQGFTMCEDALLDEPGRLYCTAVSDRNWFILPGQRLTKCTTKFDDPSEDCGRLERDGTITLLDGASKWIDFSPFDHPLCRDCNVLPVCMGGCNVLDFDGPTGTRCQIRNSIEHSLIQDPRRRATAQCGGCCESECSSC